MNRFAQSVLLVLFGLALGAAANGFGARVDAQQSSFATPRDAAIDAAAPRVSLETDGTAKFSRPLEVPPLYAFDSSLTNENGRQIVLVDAETKRICVYWIRERGANSTIELVATRTYEMDLKLENFNGEGLSPAQIREQASSPSL
ncbi:MAG: hypothetical protein IKU86_09920 [Thermoguttaceae bacterium]|nr:hypothetical protein [Thermoguttaceae bacterium]